MCSSVCLSVSQSGNRSNQKQLTDQIFMKFYGLVGRGRLLVCFTVQLRRSMRRTMWLLRRRRLQSNCRGCPPTTTDIRFTTSSGTGMRSNAFRGMHFYFSHLTHYRIAFSICNVWCCCACAFCRSAQSIDCADRQNAHNSVSVVAKFLRPVILFFFLSRNSVSQYSQR